MKRLLQLPGKIIIWTKGKEVPLFLSTKKLDKKDSDLKEHLQYLRENNIFTY